MKPIVKITPRDIAIDQINHEFKESETDALNNLINKALDNSIGDEIDGDSTYDIDDNYMEDLSW